jgi:hypothetical protein
VVTNMTANFSSHETFCPFCSRNLIHSWTDAKPNAADAAASKTSRRSSLEIFRRAPDIDVYLDN